LSHGSTRNLHRCFSTTENITTVASTEKDNVRQQSNEQHNNIPRIVLVAGFESFNRNLYETAAREAGVNLKVFADSDIRVSTKMENSDDGLNPDFKNAMENADAFVGSLVFDYDEVIALKELCDKIEGPRFIFECATELMTYNRIGTFSMEDKGGPSGPPAPVKKVLSLFSSGKEEDKINGYLKFLKIGPTLLKYVPGEKAKDVRIWLETYRYWNQGGKVNVMSMLQLISDSCRGDISLSLPDVQMTPDIGLIHPLLKDRMTYIESPRSYLDWRLSSIAYEKAQHQNFDLAPIDSPIVAILLYRKHVITEQQYLYELITLMEQQGLIPVPIFINGVEAHTIVRDLLTSRQEIDAVENGNYQRDSSFQPNMAVAVDAIVNTIGFPLVGGPAGSIEAGRNLDISGKLLEGMNVPYFVAGPLLLQSIQQWKDYGVLGLQSVVLYSLPELDGAIDTVVLGGLVGDKIELVPERVKRLTGRVKKWVQLRNTPPKDRKLAITLYGFPPNVGAVGTAALLDVPKSLENLLRRLREEGYNVGEFDAHNPDSSSGESLVAALSVLCEEPVISLGAQKMQEALNAKIERARADDNTVAATLAKVGGGLGGAYVRSLDVSMESLEHVLGEQMATKVKRAWNNERGPGMSSKGDSVVSGLQLGNVWITVQPLLGIEGDPMRLLFDRDLTPHPQYCAAYEYLRLDESEGGIGAQAIIHLGMHGTEEWLPGQPLGNDRESWSDELIGDLPNLYVYAANNPSESILAKRRGYGTIVSYNVPPYGRSGLYLELENLKELIEEYRDQMGVDMTKTKEKSPAGSDEYELKVAIWSSVQKSGIMKDVPLEFSDPLKLDVNVESDDLPDELSSVAFNDWIVKLSEYLVELQTRLFSNGLHVLGQSPSDDDLLSYVEAYFGDRKLENPSQIISDWRKEGDNESVERNDQSPSSFIPFVQNLLFSNDNNLEENAHSSETTQDAYEILDLLNKTTEEIDYVVRGLDGGYISAAPGGDLLRDGPSVLPTGRNIYSLDPYRMPSAGAWIRGQRIAEELIRQHREANNNEYPETIAVTMWGLDAIKTRGESIAIALALVGAEPVKEGTGRIVRFDLVPLSALGRPRIDVLASLSGIFRDSFANIVDLLDDMFERAAAADDEPCTLNFVKKHALELSSDGIERPAARLFSNPPGDYGSMVNEVVSSGNWEKSESLGETWKSRNVFSYGRNEGGVSKLGTARPKVLEKLLESTDRIVQEVDSVEYGLTDIQEYYANTGALKKAAENTKEIDPKTGTKKKVAISIVEAFTGDDNTRIPVRDVENILRLEYRSKLLNPRWTKSMIQQGSGGAYEVSQRFTAMVGWAATSGVDNFVFDQAAERYALDEDVAKQLQESNPEAFKNIVSRLLEAAGRGMWSADEKTLDKLRELYSDADDLIEEGSVVL